MMKWMIAIVFLSHFLQLDCQLCSTAGNFSHYFFCDNELNSGHFWAVGDNPKCSVDSNDYGQVPTEALIGKCLWILPLHLQFLKRCVGLL